MDHLPPLSPFAAMLFETQRQTIHKSAVEQARAIQENTRRFFDAERAENVTRLCNYDPGKATPFDGDAP